MCWRDDIVTHRRCIACGRPYYGDLGHRNCPGFRKPAPPPPPDPHELARWADDGGVGTPREGQQ